MSERLDFQIAPTAMKHWTASYDGPIAVLSMDVDETAGLFDGYELKPNSYDLGVGFELADVVQRVRFEHPEVKVVVMTSAKQKVFGAGTNISMLGAASHAHKVNFCKFTNETRNTIEGLWRTAVRHTSGPYAGPVGAGGVELALACYHIMPTDNGTSSVALPEVPLLAVLPGTGGLTRLTDKRKVRRDLADVFCSFGEGVKRKRALNWRLVDEVIPNARFDAGVEARARALVDASAKPNMAEGITPAPLRRVFESDGVIYSTVTVALRP